MKNRSKFAFFTTQLASHHFILAALVAALLATSGACFAAHEPSAETKVNNISCDHTLAPRQAQSLTLFQALVISNEIPVEAPLYPQRVFQETLKDLMADAENFVYPTLGDQLKSQLVDLNDQAIEHLVTRINEIGSILIQSYNESHPDSIKNKFTPSHQAQTRKILLARILVLQARAKALSQASYMDLANDTSTKTEGDAPKPPSSHLVKRVAWALGAAAVISSGMAAHYARLFLTSQPAVLHEIKEPQPGGARAPHDSPPPPEDHGNEIPPLWLQHQPLLSPNGSSLNPDVHGPCAITGSPGC